MSFGNPDHKGRPIRITLMQYRNPAMTIKQFHEYWSNHHGPLVREVLARHGVLRYNQYHLTPDYYALGRSISVALPGFELADEFDGFVEFTVRNWKHLEAVFSDPEYLEKVKPDEPVFFDMSRAKVVVGYEDVHVEDGKARHA